MTPAGHHIPAPGSRPPAPGFQWRALHPSTPDRRLHRHNSRYNVSCVGAPTDTPTQHSSHSLRVRARRATNESYVGMSKATPPPTHRHEITTISHTAHAHPCGNQTKVMSVVSEAQK